MFCDGGGRGYIDEMTAQIHDWHKVLGDRLGGVICEQCHRQGGWLFDSEGVLPRPLPT